MVTGVIITVLAFIGFVQITNNSLEYRRFKAKHPIISVLSIGLIVYILTRVIGAVFVFFFGLLLPVACECND